MPHKVDFCFKFPSRSRPKQFMKTLTRYYEYLSQKHSYYFIISLDTDDKTMNNKKMKKWLDSKPNLSYFFGDNKTKVQAINADMDKFKNMKFSTLFLISDDMVPKIKGYDDIICSDMHRYFPRKDGALHYNDGRRGSDLCTLSIMGRRLYKSFGYIYHPDYKSLWCDNEYTMVCSRANKIKYIDKIICKHEWGGANADPLYRRNENYFGKDKLMFIKRKSRGFPKDSIL